ncbi:MULTISPECIES: HlyD family secretion protein [Ramlibacter]|uniref:HlyD family efflux transporter periplasmic adaptor subunit n=1 Tax=Ramlibacter pinisoli TaxID=2682844 RepID=A0A6N8IQD0_9BURK|nr:MULTISPECIES: HlyD family efflux transporter periplasmic adaptor subunit [Ramlibacter]MBA2963956.1 HlyD family efflux transporter periplasmic adaptor subunit [Ramlibacter sp. CGMCC 1.13660]MVQ28922.1 HlyD family efflux transporter periplasmic adaptor subunit [Ramlibacter pinisoli]
MTKYRNWIIALVVLVAAGFFGWKYWQDQQAGKLPPGIASGNGRIEARLADVSAKEPLRVKEIKVQEGDLVKPGQVVVLLDTVTLESQMAESKARVAAAREQMAVVNSSIARRKGEIELANIEVERVRRMLAENASSQREYDVRRTTVVTTRAALGEEMAKLETAKQQVEVALANVQTIETRIKDATLVSPVLGRVLYRLAEPGEVLGAGGKALTLVNLEDVYMEIFLPAAQAAAVKIGSEGRIVLDTQPDRSAVGVVSFVSPEAQFTPKEVETKSERDKLMFRVKLQVPKELVGQYIQSIKTGVRGVGYVKYTDTVAWPTNLDTNVLTAKGPLESNPTSVLGASPTK